MAKFGLEAFRQRRNIMILVGVVIVTVVPSPFLLHWLESFEPEQVKNYHGLPIIWRQASTIKVRYRKITQIPVKYVNSHRIPIAYHSLSVIKVTYRNGNDGSAFDDPRFKMVRLRSTTFHVTPTLMDLLQ